MHNWRRLDPGGPLVLENLATLVRAHGSTDEIWFFTVAIAIEARGTAVPALVVGALEAAEAGERATVRDALGELEETIRAVTRLTERTREQCDPRVFYHRVRPPFSAWPAPGVRYEGTDLDGPLQLAGGSAAQSPLVQCFDAALAVRHPPAARRLHLEMRRYMAPAHRRFLAGVEASGAIRRLVRRNPDPGLRDAYDGALAALRKLREVHWKLVVDYISRQAAPGTAARGTGGTDYARFLTEARRGVERSTLGG